MRVGSWCRPLAVVTGTVLLAAASCGNDEERRDAAVADFCDALGDHFGIEAAAADDGAAAGEKDPMPIDPQTLLNSVAGLEPPEEPAALAGEWDDWQEQRRAAFLEHAARIANGDRDYLWRPDTDNEVDAFWERECVENRGYEVPVLVSDSDPELPPRDQPPGGGEVRVVEHGFTETDLPFDEVGRDISFGAVVENTSDSVAVDTEVEIRAVDGSGDPVLNEIDNEVSPTYTIPVLLPGQRFGVGGGARLPGTGTTADLEVTLVAEQWWPASHEVFEFAEITTSEVTLIRESPIEITIRYTIESEYPVAVYRTEFAIVQDPSGEVIAGANRVRHPDQVRPGHSYGAFLAGFASDETVDAIEQPGTVVEVFL